MTQTKFLLSLAFGALLISGISGDDQWIKARKHQLDEIVLLHENFVKNLTVHGLDYFADSMQKHFDPKPFYKTIPPADSPNHPWVIQVEKIHAELMNPFLPKFPWDPELFKGKAIYRNAIINVTGVVDSVGQQLENDVIELIELQKKLDSEKDEKLAEELREQFIQKTKLITEHMNPTLTLTDFYQLESLANEDIHHLNRQSKTLAAVKRKHQLDEFLLTNVQLNRIYPIDSAVRVEQYFHIALEHYRQYTQLKKLIEIDHKDDHHGHH